MPKILIITDNTQDQINGVVTTFRNIETYAEQDGYKIEYLDPSCFTNFSAPRYPEVKLSIPFDIGSKIINAQAQHIHIATEGPLGLAANLWCWRNSVKFNTSYHSKWPEFMNKLYKIPKSWTVNYLKWFHNHSGIVLTTTQSMVNELEDYGFKSNIFCWTRGVNKNIFNSNSRTTTIAGKPILLSVGRISIEKGLDDFCSIDWPGATKIIVGDGPYRSALEQKYKDVIFVGSKQHEQLAEYYANADVFVFTSVTDTFGVVNIESIACGTPVAAYDVVGPKDIIKQNITGYTVPYKTDIRIAIRKCLELDREAIENSSNEWSWENCWKIFRQHLVSV